MVEENIDLETDFLEKSFKKLNKNLERRKDFCVFLNFKSEDFAKKFKTLINEKLGEEFKKSGNFVYLKVDERKNNELISKIKRILNFYNEELENYETKEFDKNWLEKYLKSHNFQVLELGSQLKRPSLIKEERTEARTNKEKLSKDCINYDINKMRKDWSTFLSNAFEIKNEKNIERSFDKIFTFIKNFYGNDLIISQEEIDGLMMMKISQKSFKIHNKENNQEVNKKHDKLFYEFSNSLNFDHNREKEITKEVNNIFTNNDIVFEQIKNKEAQFDGVRFKILDNRNLFNLENFRKMQSNPDTFKNIIIMTIIENYKKIIMEKQEYIFNTLLRKSRQNLNKKSFESSLVEISKKTKILTYNKQTTNQQELGI